MARSIFRNVLIIKRDEIIHDREVFYAVERARKAIGLSVSDLCLLSGISRTAYYKWKSGRGIMPETLESIQTALAENGANIVNQV